MSQKKQPQAPIHADRDEGFLRRWSRRKHEVKTAATFEAPDSGAQADLNAINQAAPEPPGDEDMPPLDSLGADSDLSGFFSPRVSDNLRQAALQRLFHQPEFNVTDGLDDYCGDYRQYKPLGDIVTADMRHRMEAIKQRLTRLADTRHDSVIETPGAEPSERKDATGENQDSHGKS